MACIGNPCGYDSRDPQRVGLMSINRQPERGYAILSMLYAQVLLVHQCNQLLTKHMLFTIVLKAAFRALV